MGTLFALHALWRSDRRLAVWVEGPRPADDDHPPYPWHPFACPTETVALLLSGVGTGLEWLVNATALHRSVRILLPTRSGAPLSSPELSGPGLNDARAGGMTLTRWRIPALLFEPTEAAQLLGELYDPRRPFLPTELPGLGILDVPYGASVRWLTAVHDLAWRLVGQGQVLPTLVTEDDAPHARWHPAPDAEAWTEIGALTAAIPPICRAEAPDQSSSGLGRTFPPGTVPGRPRMGSTPAAPARTGPEHDASGHPAPDEGRIPGTASGGSARRGRTAAEVFGEVLDALVDREARAALEGWPELLDGGRGKGPATIAAERWLEALTSRTGLIEGAEPAALAALQVRLSAWHRSETAAKARLRTCFRLVEPIGSWLEWRLTFLLQAVEEPSLLVDAAEVWKGGPALRALERTVDRPKDAFLADLARAAHDYPALRRALRSVHPARLDLTLSEALDFLRDAAPMLAEAGFGVLLPTWWQRPTPVGLALTTRTPPPGIVRGDSIVPKEAIVAFTWQAALGDQVIGERELADLAVAKQPLVRVRGQWMEVDPAQIAAAAAFLAEQTSGTMPAAEAVRTALASDARVGGLPVTSVTADGRLGELLSGDLELPPVTLPADFGTELRPYQHRGVAWLSLLSQLGLGAILADDMGLGKTVQALALLATEHGVVRGEDGPTLVVCPMSLVGNWQREAARFAPMLRVHVHHGSGRPSGLRLREAVEGADLVITTYGLVQRDLGQLREIGWRRVIADEAQQIKNPATGQAKAVRALPAGHRIALTGTPVENRLGELHALLDFVNPGLFGSNARFKELYSLPIEKTGSKRATEALRRRTRPLLLRRLKTDPSIIRDLPDKQEMTVLCNLTAEQAALYRAVLADLFDGVRRSEGIERSGRVLAALSKLKQVCNHPAQFLKEKDLGARFGSRSGKVALLEETLEEALAEHDKVLVFTQFTEFGGLLQRHLAERFGGQTDDGERLGGGSETLFLHGGVSRRGREEMVARFQEPGGPSVLLLSLKAGGTGLNLTAARQVIHVDRWWNPAVEEQATDRAFRIGQRRDVQVRKFVCVGTVEERIDAMIEAKRALAETVVGTGESWLADLSTDALHELVDLSADAVSE